MNQPVFVLFVVGLVVTILGWFFNRALEVRWFARLVVPGYVHGTDALDRLEQDANIAMRPTHPGFPVLLNRWPHLVRKHEVRQIGRSIAYMQFGPKVTPDIQLIARNQLGEEIPPRWQVSAARMELSGEVNHRLFRVGTVVFFAGLALTTATGMFEYHGSSSL